MTKILANRLEGWGLIILLSSFLWQILENDLANTSLESENYKIQKKLDDFWQVYAEDYSKRSPDKGVTTWTNFKAVFEDWKIYSQGLKDTKELGHQLKFFTIVRIILFVLGSILIIIPKFTRVKD